MFLAVDPKGSPHIAPRGKHTEKVHDFLPTRERRKRGLEGKITGWTESHPGQLWRHGGAGSVRELCAVAGCAPLGAGGRTLQGDSRGATSQRPGG